MPADVVDQQFLGVRRVVAAGDRLRLGGAFWGWLVTASLVRAPVVMASVAFTSLTALVLDDPDRGGLLAAASVVGLLCGTPIAIKVQERIRPRAFLSLQMSTASLSWLALALSVGFGSSEAWWLGLAFVAGLSMSGAAGLVRSMMSAVVPAPALGRASTIDALSQDAVTFLAPVAVSIGTLAGSVGAPLAVGVVALLATVRVAMLPRRDAAADAEVAPAAGVPATAGRRKRLIWSFVSLALGLTVGGAEAGAVGLGVRLGLAVESVYVLFLVLAAASVVGAWLDITVLQRRLPSRRFAILLTSMVAGSLLISIGSFWATAVVGLSLIGLPTAALLGLRSHAFDSDAPQERRVGLTLSFAAQSAGFAAGAAILAVASQPGTMVIAASLLAIGGCLTRWLPMDRPMLGCPNLMLRSTERAEEL